eukprot:c5186_g2_i1.p1 GENE.c5186_g2_i1~~c5186_g2_i1.p1  ORF type:complete len:106 (-),score=14.35 c5186_g2_i1:189-506(-)
MHNEQFVCGACSLPSKQSQTNNRGNRRTTASMLHGVAQFFPFFIQQSCFGRDLGTTTHGPFPLPTHGGALADRRQLTTKKILSALNNLDMESRTIGRLSHLFGHL